MPKPPRPHADRPDRSSPDRRPPRSASPDRPERSDLSARPERPERPAAPASTDPVRPSGEALEGRNVVVEALRRARRTVGRIWIDVNATPDEKIREILDRAGDRVIRVPRQALDRASKTGVHNGVIAEAQPLPELYLRDILDAHPDPFIVLIDEVQYEHNLGAILRSALGAGVHAVVAPVQRGASLSPVVLRVSMGGAEAVPLVREGISSALAELQRRGIPILGADAGGLPPWEIDMRGPLAIVFGGEDKGLTPPVRKRCTQIVGIPLQGDLSSLNVSVSAGVILFERARQLARK